jgi:hypothetical protein
MNRLGQHVDYISPFSSNIPSWFSRVTADSAQTAAHRRISARISGLLLFRSNRAEVIITFLNETQSCKDDGSGDRTIGFPFLRNPTGGLTLIVCRGWLAGGGWRIFNREPNHTNLGHNWKKCAGTASWNFLFAPRRRNWRLWPTAWRIGSRVLIW